MSHYEARLDADLQEIRTRVAAVGAHVREAVDDAVRAVIACDRRKMYRVILGDHAINREIRAIDQLCHAFVARHLPAAGHLRFVSSVLRLTIALERIGDYAVTISRVAAELSGPQPDAVLGHLAHLSDQALRMLERANKAFLTGDADLARDTAKIARRVDVTHDRLFAEMTEDDDREVLQIVRVLTILGKLERVSDQAKNICEETLFSVLGEVKEPRAHPVLFVDEHNALHSPLAEALARKAYPGSGRYSSAGWSPADALDPELARLGDRLGLGLDHAPKPLRPLRPTPAEYHVIVVINGDDARLGPIPFHSSLLFWDVEPEPRGQEGYDLLARELSTRIRDLMELLRGPDAS